MSHSQGFRNRYGRAWQLAAGLSLAGCGQMSGLFHSDMAPAPVETAAPANAASAPAPAPSAAASSAPSATPVATAAPSASVTATALPPAAPSAVTPTAPPTAATGVAVAANDGAKPFYVHIGAFGVPANANNAYQKVQATGIMVTTQEVDTPKGRLTRVRAGPFLTRPEAEAAAKRIHELELDAVILRDASAH